MDSAAVEVEGGCGFVVEVVGGIVGLDGVGEGEGRGPRSRGVVDDLIGGSGFEGELGGPARGVDGDGLREDDVDGDRVAGFVGAISGGTADGLNGWSGAVDNQCLISTE